MEAAIHTSVIETKIPCDFTRELTEGCRNSAAQVAGRPGRGPWDDCCVVRGIAAAVDESEG